MSKPCSAPPRADAARNRKHLLDAATRVFMEAGAEPSLREVAREAGVGIATLYRHFPTRETLVAAVYADQVSRLTEGAHALLATLTPAEALRRWMDLFGGWIATKSGMLTTLVSMIESDEVPHGRTHDNLIAAIDELIGAGRASAELRDDVTAEDFAAHLIGIFTVAPLPEHAARAGRLLDVLMNGLRVR